ncbi:MAG: hypothetical protein ACR2P0_20800, partial [Acidimicrobiales bacterium]
MTGTPSHAADDGSFARSTGGAAARGAMLIALAVIIGLVLLAFALDDPGTPVAADDTVQPDDGGVADGSDDGTDDSTATTTPGGDSGDAPATTEAVTTITAAPPDDPGVTRPPAEVTVLVANGTTESGVAGAVSDKVKTR